MISLIVTFLSAAIITPLLMALWGKLSPPEKLSAKERSFKNLKKRNSAIDGISCILCVAGILVPLPLMARIPENLHFWALGLGFGLMVILPIVFITFATLPFGIKRFMEFWRFYELKYKIGIRGIMAIYIPVMILGFISIYAISKNI